MSVWRAIARMFDGIFLSASASPTLQPGKVHPDTTVLFFCCTATGTERLELLDYDPPLGSGPAKWIVAQAGYP